MKAILAIVATVLSAPALVAGVCVNKQFKSGWNAAPPGCEYGWSVYEKTGCQGQSGTFCQYGGFYSGPGSFVPQSYYCEAPKTSGVCFNRYFGYGSFMKPCSCTGGYTIYDRTGCSGNRVHLTGGFRTGSKNWVARSYKCD